MQQQNRGESWYRALEHAICAAIPIVAFAYARLVANSSPSARNPQHVWTSFITRLAAEEGITLAIGLACALPVHVARKYIRTRTLNRAVYTAPTAKASATAVLLA